MKLIKEIKRLLEAKEMPDSLELCFIEPNETAPECRKRNNVSDRAYEIYILPDDINYHKIKYLESIDVDSLLETKTIRQILDEHKETITDPEELENWNYITGSYKYGGSDETN